MTQRVCVVVSAAEREQLAVIAADRNRPRKHIERAQIVLCSGVIGIDQKGRSRLVASKTR